MELMDLMKKVVKEFDERGGLKNVIWIACGGSAGGFYPAHFLLEHEARGIKTTTVTSNEFVYAPLVCCDKNTLAVLCSMRGTPETCEAAKKAKESGAVTIGLYVQESELTKTCDHNIQYSSIAEDSSMAEDVNSSVGLNIAFHLLYLLEDYAYYNEAMEGFQIIDDIYRDAVKYCMPRAKNFAAECKDDPVVYVMGSGSSLGAAYIFSICNLMEMQWVHSPTIHTGEFFHGPFEVLDKNLPVFLLIAEGRTRPMDLRAQEFLRQYGERIYVLDAKELGINRISDRVSEYFNHILFAPILNNTYLRELAVAKKHNYLNRRYMWKVKY